PLAGVCAVKEDDGTRRWLGAERRTLADGLLQLERLAVVGLACQHVAGNRRGVILLTNRRELGRGGEVGGRLREGLLFSRGCLEGGSAALGLAVEQDLVLAVPAVARQPAGKEDSLERAVAQRDDLRRELAAAVDRTGVLTLDRKVGRQGLVVRVGPDALGLGGLLGLLGVGGGSQAHDQQTQGEDAKGIHVGCSFV